MKGKTKKEKHYGHEVWVNPLTESIRKEECLCFNCDNLKPEKSDNCSIAQSLYKICLEKNVAMIITRCPAWKPKNS